MYGTLLSNMGAVLVPAKISVWKRSGARRGAAQRRICAIAPRISQCLSGVTEENENASQYEFSDCYNVQDHVSRVRLGLAFAMRMHDNASPSLLT